MTTNKVTVTVLKRRLRQTAWLPLALVMASLLCAVAFILKSNFDERLKNTASALSDIIESNKTAISQDVLVNHAQSTQERVKQILESWHDKYPATLACIHVSVTTPEDTIKQMAGCSNDANPPPNLQGGRDAKVTEIKHGAETLATIEYAALRPTTLSDLLPPLLLVTLGIALIAAILAHRLLVQRLERTVLEPLLSKISEDERKSAIAETAQMLAHDIKKPLQAIRMAVRNMVDSSNKTVRQIGEKVSLDIEASIRAINAMLDDIIDVSREMHLTKNDIEIKDLLSATTEGILRLHPESVVNTIYDLQSDKKVTADREKVARVISNLVENAVHAVGSRGTLRLVTKDFIERGKAYVQVSVINDGPLIEAQDIPMLFSPFFTRKKKGTGLGLAISKKIVISHGGQVSCHSSREQGTIFSFTLPAAQTERAERTEPKEAAGKPLSSIIEKTILIFDDERVVHSAWRSHAEKYSDITFVHFMSWEDFVAQDGFALVKDSIAFVDICYKGSKSDGFDIVRALRKLGVRRAYAFTSAPEIARETGLFDEVFDKEIPKDFDRLIVS